MPPIPTLQQLVTRTSVKPFLLTKGVLRCRKFCEVNSLPIPSFNVIPSNGWLVTACAFYRPDTEVMRKWTKPGISICLSKCSHPAMEHDKRNWNWPGSITDREPYGVLCHELGHHCDWLTGDIKYTYSSNYGFSVRDEADEQGITSYCNDPAEWFAEMFRLFVTNHALLRILRPRTHAILTKKFKPVSGDDWQKELGEDVPPRILKNLKRKIAEDGT